MDYLTKVVLAAVYDILENSDNLKKTTARLNTLLSNRYECASEMLCVLTVVYNIIETSKDLEEAKRRVAKIANVEGVILKPSEEEKEHNG